MVTIKGIAKKLLTLDGVIKIIIVLFVMNLTHFGREIKAKIMTAFRLGMSGV